jgi:hypothetical protein
MTDKKNNHYAVASLTKNPNVSKSYIVTVDQFNQLIIPVGFAKSNDTVL